MFGGLALTCLSFVTAHLKGGRQREGSLAAPADVKELGLSLCRVPSLPLVTDMGKVQGLKHQPAQAQTALGIALQKADAVSLLVWLIGKHILGDLSVFLEMELGIWRDFWYFLLSIRLNILKDDLYLDILPLLILM